MEEKIKELLEEVNEAMNGQGEVTSNQLNLIEELRILKNKNIRENAHSRILNKLLNYKDNSSFLIYESFIKFIKEKFPDEKKWHLIQPKSPVIKTEVSCGNDVDLRGSIDILVEDKEDANSKYAIIIENKANEAGDQTKQIERYICRERNEGFNDDQIFVLYLPREDGGSPDEQSWGDCVDFKRDRYISFSYKTSFLGWLENVKTIATDELTKCGILQYEDYLKRWLKSEESNSAKREKVIKDFLDLENKGLNMKLATLGEYLWKIRIQKEKLKTESVYDINDSLKSILFDELSSLISEYPYRTFEVYNSTSFQNRKLYMGYSFAYKNNSYLLYIGSNASGLFCSIISNEGQNIINIDGDLQDTLNGLLDKRPRNGNIYYLYDSYDKGYNFENKVNTFVEALGRINQEISQNNNE